MHGQYSCDDGCFGGEIMNHGYASTMLAGNAMKIDSPLM